ARPERGHFLHGRHRPKGAGAWKMATSIKNLGSKATRLGTYDTNINRIGD
ncbi:toxin C-terminal domain-containing protein, partial [Rhizobium leguminosarum]